MNPSTVKGCDMRRTHPYTAMLCDYESAAALIKTRLAELNAELSLLLSAADKCSSAKRLLLEKRIQILREEHLEIRLDIEKIREYAERERP